MKGISRFDIRYQMINNERLKNKLQEANKIIEDLVGFQTSEEFDKVLKRAEKYVKDNYVSTTD